MGKKSQVTQRIVNSYPAWSATRLDEQSLNQQFFNVPGARFEDLDKQLQTIGKNYFLTTVNLDEIDLVHKFDLDPTFTFTSDTTDTSHTVFTAPTVSGEDSGSFFPVYVASGNNIETFWYTDCRPTRVTEISPNTTVSGSYTVLSKTDVGESPLSTGLSDPHKDGHLHVTVSGGTNFLGAVNGLPTRGTVILEGTTRRGTEETETMIFVFNNTQRTQKEWQSIDTVRVFGIDPTTAEVDIASARYISPPYRDSYDLYHGFSKEKVETFWGTSTTPSGDSSLTLVRYTSDIFQNILLGIQDFEDVKEWELLTVAGLNYTAVDIAPQPFSDCIWAVSLDTLYLYDNQETLPEMNVLNKKQYDANIRIEPDSYHKLLGEDVELTYRFVRQIKTLGSHRVSVQYPDGRVFYIVDGVVGSDVNFKFGQVSDIQIRNPDTITLGQRGDYLFTFEVKFTDGTKETDQRIVTVDSKTAVAEFALTFEASGIDFNSDQELWILDVSGIHHRIDRHYDTMLVDYDRKTIYFREPYDDLVINA